VFLRRFQREARNLERLQHPYIVRFYGLEQDEGLAFMLMDYIEGTTLRKEIFRAEGPFTERKALEVLRPVCAALHYAHNLGVVHCDVKPANIMLERSGRVLVADFGIARMAESTTTTLVGAGTPAYMAPEQVTGGEPSPQTDLYALGIVLYELLTGGERPFTGEQAGITGSTTEKVLWEQNHLAPPAPRRYNPDLSPELEAVEKIVLEPETGFETRVYGSEDGLQAAPEQNPTLPVEKPPVEREPGHIFPVEDLPQVEQEQDPAQLVEEPEPAEGEPSPADIMEEAGVGPGVGYTTRVDESEGALPVASEQSSVLPAEEPQQAEREPESADQVEEAGGEAGTGYTTLPVEELLQVEHEQGPASPVEEAGVEPGTRYTTHVDESKEAPGGAGEKPALPVEEAPQAKYELGRADRLEEASVEAGTDYTTRVFEPEGGPPVEHEQGPARPVEAPPAEGEAKQVFPVEEPLTEKMEAPGARTAFLAWVVAAFLLLSVGGGLWLWGGGGGKSPVPTESSMAQIITKAPTAPPTPSATIDPTPTLGIGSTQVSEKDGMTLVYVPSGKFSMGVSDLNPEAEADENPQHSVYLDAFWIDQTEVTTAMYTRCVQSEACRLPEDASSASRPAYYGNALYEDYPVIYISWEDASAYCAWAGRRLPSEAEWEKAARGTDGLIYPWGDTAPDPSLLNFDDRANDTTEVGKFPSGASPYGALDLAGNVYEWVQDWYQGGYYYSSPVRNPTGPDWGDDRVVRGGSWDSVARNVRASNRNWGVPDGESSDIGFRCAVSPAETAAPVRLEARNTMGLISWPVTGPGMRRR
jgi:formylglycine-generating enzyme required for sulfatase activity